MNNKKTANEYATWLVCDVYNTSNTTQKIDLRFDCVYLFSESYDDQLLRESNVYVGFWNGGQMITSDGYTNWDMPAHSKISLSIKLSPGTAGILEQTEYVYLESKLLLSPPILYLKYKIK